MEWESALERLRELLGTPAAFSFAVAIASDYGVVETRAAPPSASVRPILGPDVIAFGTGSGEISLPRAEVEALECVDHG